MKMRLPQNRVFQALLLLPPLGGVVFAAGAALSQDAAGGLQLDFNLSSTLRYNDNLQLSVNPAGSTVMLDNSLGFALFSRGPVGELALNGSGVLRYADLPDGDDSGFDSPRLGFSYKRAGVSSKLDLAASWQRADLRFLNPLADPVLIEDLTTGELVLAPQTGTRTITGYSGNYVLGTGQPLGLTLGFSHRAVDYVDTVDPKYYDSTTNRLSLSFRMDINPVLSTTLSVGGSRYDADNRSDTTRDSRDISLGMTYSLDAATKLSASLGRSRVEEDETSGGVRSTDLTEGATGSLSFNRELGNGDFGVSLARNISSSGAHDSLRFSRSMELRAGELSGMVGVTRNNSGKAALIADVAWEQGLPRGSWSLSLRRGVTTNDDDEDVVVTRLNAGLNRQINNNNSLNLGLSLSNIESDAVNDDSQRANLSVSWRRELTSAVDMSLGYEYSWLDEEDAGDRDSNSVFLRVGSRFSFRP